MEFKDLIEKSKYFYKLENDNFFIFNELNNLNEKRINELDKELKLDEIFGPVKLLRYIVLSEIKNKHKIDEIIIDDIKRKIENRDVSEYTNLPVEYLNKLTSYPKKKKGMFPNWKVPFKILFPFFNSKNDKNDIKKLLDGFGDEIIDRYKIKDVKIFSNGFEGSQNYGTSELYTVIINDKFKSIRDAYQIVFRLVNGEIEGGIYKGDHIKKDYNKPHDKYNNWEDFINSIGSVIPEWEELNEKHISETPPKEDKLDEDKANSNSEMNTPLNQILYGPPGTGKTYNTINKAIEIINPEFDTKQDRGEVKKEYDRLVEVGQIVFTTFHQSMSYEDFVEGIKPQEPENKGDNITYKVDSGIFKKICIEAQKIKDISIDLEGEGLELTPEIFGGLYDSYLQKFNKIGDGESEYTLKTKAQGKKFKIYRNSNSIVVYAGDTEMSISKQHLTRVIFEGEDPMYSSYVNIIIDDIKKGFSVFDKEIDNPSKNYVLIIDEINRGNVSSILGELITLLEDDKRLGGDEKLEITLPYSKIKFGVPSNLYIIGTMNTADRSVEALDSALRRRFTFEEMPPNPEVLKNEHKTKGNIKINDTTISLIEILKTINERIEILLDRDHLIGHSFFMKVNDEESLKNTFAKNIIPLLQEYFYGDYGKIALVLGEGFCEKREETTKFARVNGYESEDYSEAKIFTIKPINDSFEIDEAINTLLLIKE